MMYIKLIFLLLLTACTATVPPIQKINDSEYKIIGKLDKHEYDEIIHIVKDNPSKDINFYVSSGGGTSDDLFEAMDAVYAHGHVHWYSLNQCDSACAVMALSTKHAHGEFRLHSFYKHHHHHVEASPEFNEKVLNKLGSYGYDQLRLYHMFHSVEELWPFCMNEDIMTEE
jgi:hypothetical protein